MIKNFHIQGHRGARGLMPENTIEACIQAIKNGIDGLEIDVVVSGDHQIVVSHEPWMSPVFCRFPNGNPVQLPNIYLKNLTHEAIKDYDCGQRGNPDFPNQKSLKAYKPTLNALIKAVMGFCKSENVKLPFFNIEVKSHPTWYRKLVPPPNVFVHLLKEPFSQLRSENVPFYISSFDPIFLRTMKRVMPDVLLAFLTENKLSLELNLRRLGFKPEFYSPFHAFLTRKMVKNAHQRGIKVVTWTVNDVKRIAHLKKMGVDGIITDYPNLYCFYEEKMG